MEVRIDYDMELIYSEKKKVRWLIEEFEMQFGKGNSHFAPEQKKMGNEFMDYIMKNVEYSNPDVFDFFQTQIEKIEKKYPNLFK